MQTVTSRTVPLHRLVRGTYKSLPPTYCFHYRGQWSSQRTIISGVKSPLEWFRRKLSPSARPKADPEAIAAAKEESQKRGEGNLFDEMAQDEEQEVEEEVTSDKGVTTVKRKKKEPKVHTEHKYSTANFKISHRKLNMLARQIAGKPIDAAILQMVFSEKRASRRIKSTLCLARDHAVMYKNLQRDKLVVAEAWVNKGPKQIKRVEPKGRGRTGVRVHPDSRMHILLKEGKSIEEKREQERRRKLKRIASAGMVREDVPLRNLGMSWAW